MAAAVLPVPYLDRVVPKKKRDLLPERHRTGEVAEEVPDCRSSFLMHLPSYLPHSIMQSLDETDPWGKVEAEVEVKDIAERPFK
jgi:hypothetical protein